MAMVSLMGVSFNRGSTVYIYIVPIAKSAIRHVILMYGCTCT